MDSSSFSLPVVVVLTVQWLLAVFVLSSYVRAAGFFLGLFGPLWIVPIGSMAAQYVSGRPFPSMVVGGVIGVLAGAIVTWSVAPTEIWWGIGYTAYFASAISGRLSSGRIQLHLIWAFFSTAFLFVLIGGIPNATFLLDDPLRSEALIASGIAGFVGLLISEAVRMGGSSSILQSLDWHRRHRLSIIGIGILGLALCLGGGMDLRALTARVKDQETQKTAKSSKADSDTEVPDNCEPFIIDLKSGTVSGLRATSSEVQILQHTFCTNGHTQDDQSREILEHQIRFPRAGVEFDSNLINIRYRPPAPIRLSPEIPDRDVTSTLKEWGTPTHYSSEWSEPVLSYETPTGCLEMVYSKDGSLDMIHLRALACTPPKSTGENPNIK